MSPLRTTYTVNASSTYLSSYPHNQEELSDDGYKTPYEDDIIDSYTSTDYAYPNHSHSPSHHPDLPYLSPSDRDPKHPPYPAFTQKPYINDPSASSDFGSEPQDGGESDLHVLPATKERTEPRRSFWATILPDSLACRFYVLTVLVETIIDIAIVADLFLRFHESQGDGDAGTRRLPIYLAVFAFAHLFQLVMAIDAVYARNTLQFLFLTVFNVLFLVYAVILIFEIRSSIVPGTTGISDIPVNILTTIIPIVISVAEIAYIALGWKIWSEFGWKVYKLLGADRRVKRMFAQYQIFICLIKFDVFFFIGFSVQLIWLVLTPNNWEWYVTCAALPLSFLLLLDGHLAARHENRYLMVTFMLGCVGAMVYFVYKLYKVVKLRDELKVAKDITSLTVFSVISICLLLATFVLACIVMRNFDAGLKYHMSKAKKSQSQTLRRRGTEHQHRHSSYPMSSNPNRMSIE